MRAWLIYSEYESRRNSGYINLYFEKCGERGITLSLLIHERMSTAIIGGRNCILYDGDNLPPPDFAICRHPDHTLTRHMEAMGIPVFNNSHVSEICNDKMRTYQYVSSLGVDIMDTAEAYGVNCPLPYPVVIKSVGGKGGSEVFLVNNDEEFNAASGKLAGKRRLVQAVASERGRDLRVYVLGDEIITSVLRSSDTDFKANYSLGGSISLYSLSDTEHSTVNKIISAFNFGLVGIDFIFDKGKIVFNEIEDVVGARMVYSLTDIDVAGRYLDFILSQI